VDRFLPGRAMQAFELDDRDAELVGSSDGESSADRSHAHAGLSHDAGCKLTVSNRVHRDGDYSRQQAAQKRCDPFAGIFTPDENAVAFGDAARG